MSLRSWIAGPASAPGLFSLRGRVALAVFTRYPVPGQSKTRLIPALGPEAAAALQRDMTEHTLATALPPAKHWRTVVYFVGGSFEHMHGWLGAGFTLVPQSQGNLGDRMLQAALREFSHGAARVVIIGSDCPGITAGILAQAEELLSRHDVVFGPADDGGFYLIGLRRGAALPELFHNVSWGNDDVLAVTRENVLHAGLRVAALPALRDIDRLEDLPHWEAARTSARISVVIPALNEATHIENTIRGCLRAHNVEVLVADGGSVDDTVHQAAAAGARIVHSPEGRARQMNAGADAATGGILLFLHADTKLPARFDQDVRKLLAENDVLGAFRLRLDARGGGYRVIEWGVFLRARLLGFPYGDQCLFLTRDFFHRLGGFPEQPILEDYELVRRAGRVGRIRFTTSCVTTSARRWEKRGLWRTSLLNAVIFLAYPLGVSADRIARWYGRAPK